MYTKQIFKLFFWILILFNLILFVVKLTDLGINTLLLIKFKPIEIIVFKKVNKFVFQYHFLIPKLIHFVYVLKKNIYMYIY